MDKKELAVSLHKKRYNCCQAVVCSFAEEIGMDAETLFKATEGFGLGMGTMQCTCGALSGAVMLAGLKNSDGKLDDPKTKASTYQLIKKITDVFTEKTGSTVCKELKGIDTGKLLCSCPDCIRAGVEAAEEVLGLRQP